MRIFGQPVWKPAATLVTLAGAVSLTACQSQYVQTFAGLSNTGKPLANHPTQSEREQTIANETGESPYIGRRYFIKGTTFWGYVRKPNEPWSRSQLVVINESKQHQPDRLPESGKSPLLFGYDQNSEYKLWGKFTGKKVYDPNSNQMLPEFKLSSYELVSDQPGWLFSPKDRYNGKDMTLPIYTKQ